MTGTNGRPTGLLARVLPPAARPSRRAVHVLERNLRVNRRSWVPIVSGFVEPFFYLFAIGVGLGDLVGQVEVPGGGEVSYAAYLAPAMLAGAAMNGAVFESTFNIYFKLRFSKIYDAVLATPVAPGDIAMGEIGWSLARGGLYATGFLLVMAGFGLIASPLAVLALPAALLIGLAFAALGMTATTFMRSWQDFDLVTLVTLPLFLFSATFYPLSVYPGWLQPLVQVSPLYHGVTLVRALTLGDAGWSLLVHAGVLLVMGLAGLTLAGRRLEQLLLR